MLGSPILYLKGMRAIMFQLSGFYYRSLQGTLEAPISKNEESLLLGVWGLGFAVSGLGCRALC